MVILQKVEECQNRNDYPYSIKRSKDDDTTMVILHQIKGARQSQSPPTNQRLCEVIRLVKKKKEKESRNHLQPKKKYARSYDLLKKKKKERAKKMAKNNENKR